MRQRFLGKLAVGHPRSTALDHAENHGLPACESVPDEQISDVPGPNFVA